MGDMINGIKAPNFPLKDQQGKNLRWFNSPPLTIENLKGKVVLVDFWTYSCINCQRTLPIIRKWWDKYQGLGLVIIGVHTPEFEFEKDEKNVKNALGKYHISWPVVMDNDYLIWELYSNRYWPAKYLVNHQGEIIYNHFGEGNYIETEVKIQSALKDAGFKVASTLSSQFENESGALWKTQTPEIYLGSMRANYDSATITFEGQWKVEKEYVQHHRETADLEDILVLKYTAREVFLVMSSEDNCAVKVYVTLDGVPLTEENAGAGVKFESEKAVVEITFPTLYHLVRTKTFGDHILRISTTSSKLKCFAFTFGS